MPVVTSKDGTPIAYDRQGTGPAVILVGGALVDPNTGEAGRSENAPLARELAAHFTVYNYDRRGRGKSGDTLPYVLEREFEDLSALLIEAGGSAHLFGASSGGALALEAAAVGLPIPKLAVYEVPYFADDAVWQQWRDYVEKLHAALAKGDRGAAVELFMQVAGSSHEGIQAARNSPMWPALEAVAHTLAYDAACQGTELPTTRLATLTQPTLVLTGESLDLFEQGAEATAAAIPRGQRLTIQGLSHVVDAKALAPPLTHFFNS